MTATGPDTDEDWSTFLRMTMELRESLRVRAGAVDARDQRALQLVARRCRERIRATLGDSALSFGERAQVFEGIVLSRSVALARLAIAATADDPEGDIRWYALQTAFLIAPSRFREVFVRALSDPAPQVRRAAANYLGSGFRNSRSASTVRDALAAIVDDPSEDWEVRLFAFRSLAAHRGRALDRRFESVAASPSSPFQREALGIVLSRDRRRRDPLAGPRGRPECPHVDWSLRLSASVSQLFRPTTGRVLAVVAGGASVLEVVALDATTRRFGEQTDARGLDFRAATVLGGAVVAAPAEFGDLGAVLWIDGDGIRRESIAPMRIPRRSAALVPLDDHIVLAVGGRDAEGNPCTTVEAYDLRTDGWTSLCPLPGARGEPSGVHCVSRVAVVGGPPPEGFSLDLYDTSADKWRRHVPQWNFARDGRPVSARFRSPLLGPDARITLFGQATPRRPGSPTPLCGVAEFDPAAGAFGACLWAPPLNVPSDHTVGIACAGGLLVLGGGSRLLTLVDGGWRLGRDLSRILGPSIAAEVLSCGSGVMLPDGSLLLASLPDGTLPVLRPTCWVPE